MWECARYLEYKQREEIQTELYRQWGIELSTGSLSYLCDRFLTHLEALHLARVPQLRAALGDGYPLHIDATCEHGKGGLFVCMDGWRGWVLVAGRIPSEHEDHLRPLVEKTTRLFGEPIALVRDMGSGGAKAVAALREQGIPDLICHFHFLAAVGKKLFEQPYALLRKLLKSSKVRTDLRALLRDLRDYPTTSPHEGRFGKGVVREDLLALVLWILEGDGTKDLLYPFALVHLAFFQRCRAGAATCLLLGAGATDAARAARHRPSCHPHSPIRQGQPLHHRRHPPGGRLAGLLRIARRAATVQRRIAARRCACAPERARAPGGAPDARDRGGAARITGPNSPSGSRPRRAQARPRHRPAVVIVNYLDRYGERLFGHPTQRDEEGRIVAIVERTNNVPEHFFGSEKQHLRRRLGRANLGTRSGGPAGPSRSGRQPAPPRLRSCALRLPGASSHGVRRTR